MVNWFDDAQDEDDEFIEAAKVYKKRKGKK